MTNPNNLSNDLNELVAKVGNAVKQKKLSIFCGAGISYNSGLPLAQGLLKNILSAIDVNENDSATLLNSNLPFEAFIQTLADESNVDDILDIFSNGKPNTNHELIAELITKGFVNTILTTNFDLLIENALVSRGFENGNQFEVYKTEEDFGNLKWDTQKVKIIKIHGCVTNKEEMAITLEAVASKRISQNKSEIINSFFSNKINPFICVLGYSCSDIFDITPQIELIEKESSEVYLIDHSNNVSQFTIEDIALRKTKNPFQNFKGVRIQINADTFIKKVWETILTTPYLYKSSSFMWKENTAKWLTKSIEYSIGIKNHIAGRLFYDIGEYEYSVKRWEQGIAIAQNEGNQLFFYSQLGNLGMAFNALGKYKEAKKCLQESVNACNDIGNLQGEVAQLQALGNVHRNLREFDEAIKVFTKAVSLAEKNELDGLCTSLGNLATVYNQTEQFDEAIKILQKGIAIALATGNKQSEGSMLCSLGIAFFQKGDYDKGLHFVKESVTATQIIGDRQGECMALLNLSNFYLHYKEFDNCLKHSTHALSIAQKIGIRQSEAGSYYNIGSSMLFKGDAKSAIPNFKKAIIIYSDIYGNEHSHTISAIKALYRAENFPGVDEVKEFNQV